MSLATEELEIRTSAARVDMEAERIRSSIRMESEPGTTKAGSGLGEGRHPGPNGSAGEEIIGERLDLFESQEAEDQGGERISDDDRSLDSHGLKSLVRFMEAL